MQNVDFLPLEYRQKHAARQVQPWRIVVVAVFGILVASAALAQYYHRSRVKGELTAIEPSYDEAMRQASQLTSLQSQVQDAESAAELYAYFRHPWPRTQLLNAVTSPLPSEVVLTSFQVTREAQADAAAADQRPQAERKAEEENLAKMPPEARDLKRLREECDKTRTVIRIAGTTTDTVALHRFLALLGKSDLFIKAEIRSIESVESKQGLTFRFQAWLAVRPGYGQPGGPTNAKKIGTVPHLGNLTQE